MESAKCKFVHVEKVKIKDPNQIQFVKTMRLCGHKLQYYKSPDGTYEGPAVNKLQITNNTLQFLSDIIPHVYEINGYVVCKTLSTSQ